MADDGELVAVGGAIRYYYVFVTSKAGRCVASASLERCCHDWVVNICAHF
jgi:hypothetical protein